MGLLWGNEKKRRTHRVTCATMIKWRVYTLVSWKPNIHNVFNIS